MAHARAKLTVLGRQLLVNRVEVDGWKPADAAKAMGVSRQTAYKWLRRFRDEGPAASTTAPRHPGTVRTDSTPTRWPPLWLPVSRRSMGRTGWPMRWGGPVRPSMGCSVESGSRG